MRWTLLVALCACSPGSPTTPAPGSTGQSAAPASAPTPAPASTPPPAVPIPARLEALIKASEACDLRPRQRLAYPCGAYRQLTRFLTLDEERPSLDAVARAVGPLIEGPADAPRTRVAIALLEDRHLLGLSKARLLRLLEAPNPAARSAALHIIATHGSEPAAQKALALLAHDPSATVREAAARLLGAPAHRKHRARSEPALVAALAKEADVDAQRAMLMALGALEAQSAKAPMLAFLAHPKLGGVAARQLIRLNDATVDQAIVRRLLDFKAGDRVDRAFLTAINATRDRPWFDAQAVRAAYTHIRSILDGQDGLASRLTLRELTRQLDALPPPPTKP